MTNRTFIRLAVFAAALALCACQESKLSPNNVYATGSSNVVVEDSREYATNDNNSLSVGGQPVYYLIAKIVFTNTYGYDMAPMISHFTLQDPNQNMYSAYDSGSTVFAGVSNYSGILKKDEKHEYIIGFRVNQGTTGQIFYQP